MKILGALALAAALSLSPVAGARADDVWLLDIVSIPSGASAHLADSYVGALDIVARRHGGVRVSRLRESGADERRVRLVGLWRFPTTTALEALVADPAYVSIRRLRQSTFDTETSSTLQLIADRSPSAR
jgi:uncharacterized protein (DUF1330 family)